jgi:hypothetical protein
MTIDAADPKGGADVQDVTNVVAHLVEEFDGTVPESLVAMTVQTARKDLTGQIAPEAMDEMLHCLVRYRLGRSLTGGH